MIVLFIGGYPKGFDTAFSFETKSGRILRGLVKKHKLPALYFDLWKNEEEEKKGIVSQETYEHLKKFDSECIMVALGKWQQKALSKTDVKFRSAPHPAARNPKCIVELDSILSKIEVEL